MVDCPVEQALFPQQSLMGVCVCAFSGYAVCFRNEQTPSKPPTLEQITLTRGVEKWKGLAPRGRLDVPQTLEGHLWVVFFGASFV